MTVPGALGADPLTSDEALLAQAGELVQQAFRRQLWLMFLDETDRLMGVLPRIDIPSKPDGPASRFLAENLCSVAKEIGAAELAIVYERPGPERLTAADRRWLRLLASDAGRNGIPVRGPLFAHARGVRWVGPEDLDDPPA